MNKLSLSTENLGKVGKGALIAASGAVLAYLVDALPQFDLGLWGPAVAALLSVLVNYVRKLRGEGVLKAKPPVKKTKKKEK